MIKIGIDAGVNTGYAEKLNDEYTAIESMTIIKAMECVLVAQASAKALGIGLIVYLEDARLRTWFTGGREKAQGAGSIKRDCQIWEQFFEQHGIEYMLIAPKNNVTKTKAEYFKRITGWQGRTNSHARDAAMLIYGR